MTTVSGLNWVQNRSTTASQSSVTLPGMAALSTSNRSIFLPKFRSLRRFFNNSEKML